MVEGESHGSEEREGNVEKGEEGVKDLEKGEVGLQEKVVESNNINQNDFHLSRLQRLNPSNPLRIVLNSSTRVATPSPSQFSQASHHRSTPTPQVSYFIRLN